ncbi:MAG: polynucleotide adenylyltransferase PcnB [Gammaproteobacteria bacterium]|nr:polynucleotide adenylyltransferase PcnB [Gammaproteobacteria bacterium]
MSHYKRLVQGIKRIFKPSTDELDLQSRLRVKEQINHTPTIIPRAEHPVSRKNISKNAVNVLYKLKKAGYQAYLVGGGTRDLLLEHKPKDFDVVTDARPEEVNSLFRNCRLIGRRFRLAHIHFGREIIEVATFRAQHDGENGENGEGVMLDGRIVRDNVYGTFEEDVWRRDFTINALYYNIYDFSVVDFTRGMADLNAGILRLIGDPILRYQEDPVRMLRAVRFAAKLDFEIHPHTKEPIYAMHDLLKTVPASRLYDEVLKLFLTGHAAKSFVQLQHYGLFELLFPLTAPHLSEAPARMLIELALAGTDTRLAEKKSVTPAFLFAAMMWAPVQRLVRSYQDEEKSEQQSLYDASHEIFRQQAVLVAIPKRFTLVIREIWNLQIRLGKQGGKRRLRILHHPRFRAAYDFLLLRAQADESLQEQADWWTRFQDAGEKERLDMAQKSAQPNKRPRRRRRCQTPVKELPTSELS